MHPFIAFLLACLALPNLFVFAGFVPTMTTNTSGFVGSPGRRCLSSPSEEWKRRDRELMAIHKRGVTSGTVKVPRSINIDVYFHVIAAYPNKWDYGLATQQVDDQMAVLNDRYRTHNIHFNLVNTDFTVNKFWSWGKNFPLEPGDPGYRSDYDKELKRALRQGEYRTLNIYSVLYARPVNVAAGYAYFPEEGILWGSNKFILDDVIFNCHCLPGGETESQNKSVTLVLEVGHWLGLLHVYENGCEGKDKIGDEVDDTPNQKEPSGRCDMVPIPKSCPMFADSLDNIFNYMDDTNDDCYREFTQERVHLVLYPTQRY